MAVKPAMHGRDHCPGGSDPIPCLSSTMMPWIRRSRTIGSTPLTLGSGGGDVAITFDATAGSDDYTTYFSTPTSGTIRILADGIYIISAEWKFVSTFSGDIFFILGDELQNNTTFLNRIDTAEGGQQGFCFMQHWEAQTDLTFSMSQKSGSNQDIDWGFVELVRLSAYTGPGPSTLDPDE